MKRRIVKNTTALLATRVINQLAGFILVVYATRSLGVADFGTYSFLVAFYLTFELISFFGLSNYLPREIGRNPDAAGKYYFHASLLSGAVAVVMAGAMNGAAFFYHLSPPVHLAAVVLSTALLPAALGASAEATFIGIERAEFITAFTFIKRFLVTAFSLAVLAAGHGVLALIVVRAVVEYAAAAISVPLCAVKTKASAEKVDPRFARAMVTNVVPFAALAVLASFYWRLDVLLLQKLSGATDVGIYSASYRLMFLLTLVPESFMNAVYPNLARLWKENRPAMEQLAERCLRYLLALALPAAAGAFALARPVVLLIYEVDYARSVAVFSALIFAVVPIYVNNVYYRLLFAAEQQLKSILILAVNTAVVVIGGLALIPRWGPLGAAAALLLSLAAASLQNVIFTRRLVYPTALGGKVWQTAAATAVMTAAVWALRPYVPWPLAALAGVAVYGPTAALLRVVGKQDMSYIKDVLASRRPT